MGSLTVTFQCRAEMSGTETVAPKCHVPIGPYVSRNRIIEPSDSRTLGLLNYNPHGN